MQRLTDRYDMKGNEIKDEPQISNNIPVSSTPIQKNETENSIFD